MRDIFEGVPIHGKQTVAASGEREREKNMKNFNFEHRNSIYIIFPLRGGGTLVSYRKGKNIDLVLTCFFILCTKKEKKNSSAQGFK